MKDNQNLKIIHIAPAAFDYFTDIKSDVLNLAATQKKFGLDVEVATLQYSPDSRKLSEQTGRTFPDLGQSGFYGIDEIVNHLSEFDIIHIHAPFLGVGKIWHWIIRYPKARVCVTFYHAVENSDLFSIFVALYNWIYLPRFFRRAGFIAMNDKQKFLEAFGKKYFNENYQVADIGEVMREVVTQNIHLTNEPNRVKLTMEESRAVAYVRLYNYLINQL